jgi:hypothetical protein
MSCTVMGRTMVASMGRVGGHSPEESKSSDFPGDRLLGVSERMLETPPMAREKMLATATVVW